MKSMFPQVLAAYGLALALGAVAFPSQSQAAVTFTFLDTGTFDGAGIGASETLLDTATGINVTLTTVDIIGQDGTLASDTVESHPHTTNSVGTTNALGINDADYSNSNGPYANESQDFNPGEGWVFSFDVTVNLVEINLSSQGDGAQMTISSAAFPSIVLDDGATNDDHLLGNTLVPAGTRVTIQMTGLPSAADTTVRITNLQVEAVPVPEPSGLALILLGSSLFVFSRRR